MRQKHLLTCLFFLPCHLPSALALALWFCQTLGIREFAQLNWLLHQTRGEGSYGGYATHGGPKDPPQESQGPQRSPGRPPRGPRWLKIAIEVKKIEKSEQNYELSSVFLLIPQTSDRLTFYSIFCTFQQSLLSHCC